MNAAPQYRCPHIAPHYAAPVAADWSVTVEEMAWEGALIEDECERLGDMILSYRMDGEYYPRDNSTGERGGWEYSPTFVGVMFKGRYLSPRQCAEILPREIMIEANAAASRAASEFAEREY